MAIQSKTGDPFGKNDSLAIKGCVIILMVMHHLFRTPSIYEGYEINFLFFSEEFINQLFTYFKLCVGAFAFISGYGISKSYKANREKEPLGVFYTGRIVKTLLPFWFIYLIVFALNLITAGLSGSVYFKNVNKPTGVLYMILDFLCLQSFTKTPSLDSSWWYMGAALLFILAVPLLVRMIEKAGWLACVLTVVIAPRLLGIGFLGGTAPASFLMAVALGVIFEHYGLFSFFNNVRIPMFGIKPLREAVTFLVFLGIAILGFLSYSSIKTSLLWEFSYAIVPITYILFANRYIARIPYLRTVLIFLGKHSANVFLIHTVLRSYLKDFIYAQHNFLFSIGLLFLLSLAGSIVIELLKRLLRFNKLYELLNKKTTA